MIRSTKLSLKFLTKRKVGRLNALLTAYRGAVRHFIDKLWDQDLDAKQQYQVLKDFTQTRLPPKIRVLAMRQAMGILASKPKSKPNFNGSMVVSDQVVSIEVGKGSFDIVCNLASLIPYNRIVIPTRKTSHFNHLLQLGGKINGGATISKNWVKIQVKIPDKPFKTDGRALGIDIGVNKLIVDSDGKQYGTDFKAIRDKILRKKRGSKNRRQAFLHRNYRINECVNQLPWSEIKLLGVENLKHLKTGKKPKQTRQLRRQLAPWTYRQVTERVRLKAEENRVFLKLVSPAYTSQRCPCCGMVSKDNRKGEHFRCVGCGHAADADHVGALNVLANTFG